MPEQLPGIMPPIPKGTILRFEEKNPSEIKKIHEQTAKKVF